MSEPATASRRSRVATVALVAIGLVVLNVLVVRLAIRPDPPRPGWVNVGSVVDVRDRQVMFVPDLDAYVVADDAGAPVTLVARSPHLGARVVYCPSSRWFEDPRYGSKFDRLGRYALGPAPRGLDRLPTVVSDGLIWVDPNHVTLGPPREVHALGRPDGPFCSGSD
jgi:hypothetical protein